MPHSDNPNPIPRHGKASLQKHNKWFIFSSIVTKSNNMRI